MEQIEESLKLAQQYHACFEYNDFFIPQVFSDDAEIEKRIQFYKSLERDRSRDTLHGAFLDVTIARKCFRIKEVREAASRLSFTTTGMEFATEMIVEFALSSASICEIPVVLRKDRRSSASADISRWMETFKIYCKKNR